jgi:tyrosine-protein kinase Etk/Wzc
MKIADIPSHMTLPSGSNGTVSRPQSPGETEIGDYVRLLRRHLRYIVAFSATACFLMGALSLLLPKYFESTATLLPQMEGKEGGGLGALLAAGGAAASQSMGIVVPGLPTSSTDIFIAILKSRVMADDIIRQFNLLSLYEAKTMQDARDALDAATKITLNKEKVIKITVEAKDPQLAADIANFYASNLDRLNRTLNVTKAAENRKFLARHLAETQVSLQEAEEALKDFQTRNRTVAVEIQAKAMIEAVAGLQGQITAQEVQLQVMSTYLSPDNPEFARVRSGIDELKRQVRLLESGRSAKTTVPPDRPQHGMAHVPALALEYGRLLREVKVQETVFTLLTGQYEQAKMAEARDNPTVQVLDSGVPADRKSRPKVVLNALVAGIGAFMFGCILVLLREAVANQRRDSFAQSFAA